MERGHPVRLSAKREQSLNEDTTRPAAHTGAQDVRAPLPLPILNLLPVQRFSRKRDRPQQTAGVFFLS
jgi:hypothetical protein